MELCQGFCVDRGVETKAFFTVEYSGVEQSTSVCIDCFQTALLHFTMIGEPEKLIIGLIDPINTVRPGNGSNETAQKIL